MRQGSVAVLNEWMGALECESCLVATGTDSFLAFMPTDVALSMGRLLMRKNERTGLGDDHVPCRLHLLCLNCFPLY